MSRLGTNIGLFFCFLLTAMSLIDAFHLQRISSNQVRPIICWGEEQLAVTMVNDTIDCTLCCDGNLYLRVAPGQAKKYCFYIEEPLYFIVFHSDETSSILKLILSSDEWSYLVAHKDTVALHFTLLSESNGSSRYHFTMV